MDGLFERRSAYENLNLSITDRIQVWLVALYIKIALLDQVPNSVKILRILYKILATIARSVYVTLSFIYNLRSHYVNVRYRLFYLVGPEWTTRIFVITVIVTILVAERIVDILSRSYVFRNIQSRVQ